jgi:hypothetical protein
MLSDWTIYKSNPLINVAIDGSSPIVDVGSLNMTNVAVLSGATRANVTENNYTKGIVRGRIRTLVNFTSSNNTYAGIHFLSNALDLSSGSIKTYTLSAVVYNTATSRDIRISRWSTGLSGTDTTLINIPAAFTQGIPFSLEVIWHLSVPIYNGVRVIARRGTALDFSDLATFYDAVDTSGVITSTSSEGLFYNRITAGSDTADVRFDQTSIYSTT